MAAAPRESQGLQIAVIIFAVLTIILAVTTYIFYAQSETARKDMEQAQVAKKQADDKFAGVFYQNQALKFVIGLENIDRPSVAAAKPAGADDPKVTELLARFDREMALYAQQVGEQGANNYTTVPTYLLSIITNKQAAAVDAGEETKRVATKSTQDLAAEQGRTKAAEDMGAKATADLGGERDTFNKDRAAALAEKDKLASQLVAKDALIKKEREDAQKNIATLTQQNTTYQTTNAVLKEKKEALERQTVNRFEQPDGHVTAINQSLRLVYIDVGQKDGLMRQTTFAVFHHDENGVAQAEPKARIEVVRIVGDHLAECRILEDKAADPILQKDLIFTPAWSPGDVVHFALVGFMDINRDGVSDRDLIRNVIKMSGGVIDAELQDDGTRTGNVNVNTRYLVLGEKPNERSGTRMLQEYNFMLTEVGKYGTETINVQKLMAMMGYKPEERTIELGTNAAKNEFKKRNPAKGGATAAPAGAPAGVPGFEPAAPAAPAGVPMAPAAAPAGDDPFK